MTDKLLIFEARNGLGNRLRALYSSICLARFLHRHLLVRWDGFGQYWRNTDLDFIAEDDAVLRGCEVKYFGLDFNAVNSRATLERMARDGDRVIRLSTGQMFKPYAVKLGDYQAGKTEFYRRLQLVPDLARRVDLFQQQHFADRKVLGLQVRQVDRRQYHADVELIFCHANQVVSEYDLVFFTSDDAALFDMARDRIAVDCVCTQTARPEASSDEMWVEGREPEQKLRDVCDFYLLGNCDLILHSHASTFGYEAAFLTGTRFFSIPVSAHVEYPQILPALTRPVRV